MKHLNLICFGDSITQGAGLAENRRWTAQLAFRLEGKFPGRYAVFNRGMGGNTTALALDRIQTDVIPLLPGIVLIEFGINDAYVYPWCRTPRVGIEDFRGNLEEIVRQVQAKGGRPYLIVNHPLTDRMDLHPQGNRKSIGANLQPYNAVIQEVAGTRQLGAWNLPENLRNNAIPASTLLSEDGVHLSTPGNRIYADLIFQELSCALAQPDADDR